MSRGTERQRALRRALLALCPRIPLADAQDILEAGSTGSVRALPPSIAAWLSATSHIRHRYTEYDALLDEGYDRDAARWFVLAAMNDRLMAWGSTRTLDEAEEATAPG